MDETRAPQSIEDLRHRECTRAGLASHVLDRVAAVEEFENAELFHGKGGAPGPGDGCIVPQEHVVHGGHVRPHLGALFVTTKTFEENVGDVELRRGVHRGLREGMQLRCGFERKSALAPLQQVTDDLARLVEQDSR